MNDRDSIRIGGIDFRGFCGTHEEERRYGCPLRVNLVLYTDLKAAGDSDRIGHTVDYQKVCETILQTCSARPFYLLESLASHIAEVLLEQFPIEAVMVEVVKRPRNMAGSPDHVCVRLTREREV
ncbi:MAG: dihydroneopterin aldolase [Bradymonadales bacterium]|nr:dihydroneopterin aldolase [Bradymonadales bacterium]